MEPWQYLKAYVGMTKDEHDLFIQSCWAEAEAIVSRFVGDASVPAEVYTRAIMETGANLFQRRKAGNNQAEGFANGQVPVFTAKDAMSSVYPMLKPYVGWF